MRKSKQQCYLKEGFLRIKHPSLSNKSRNIFLILFLILTHLQHSKFNAVWLQEILTKEEVQTRGSVWESKIYVHTNLVDLLSTSC